MRRAAPTNVLKRKGWRNSLARGASVPSKDAPSNKKPGKLPGFLLWTSVVAETVRVAI
jgi:hypothetical protein